MLRQTGLFESGAKARWIAGKAEDLLAAKRKVQRFKKRKI